MTEQDENADPAPTGVTEEVDAERSGVTSSRRRSEFLAFVEANLGRELPARSRKATRNPDAGNRG